jgi:hypothetical protein
MTTTNVGTLASPKHIPTPEVQVSNAFAKRVLKKANQAIPKGLTTLNVWRFYDDKPGLTFNYHYVCPWGVEHTKEFYVPRNKVMSTLDQASTKCALQVVRNVVADTILYMLATTMRKTNDAIVDIQAINSSLNYIAEAMREPR